MLSRGGYWAEPLPGDGRRDRCRTRRPSPSWPRSTCPNPNALRLVRTLTLDGAYVAARLVGGSVRIVVDLAGADALPFVQPRTGTRRRSPRRQAQPRRRRLVARRELAPVLPDQAPGRDGREGAPARPVPQRAPAGRRSPGLGMLTVLTVDLDEGPRAVDSVAVMTDGADRLRVAGEPLRRDRALGRPARRRNADAGASRASRPRSTSSTSRARRRRSTAAAARCPGYLLSQWSLSEYGGVLRVVSTETPAWWGAGGETESFLTTLRPRDGALVQAGRIGGLGKGERVYAVRFAGDIGYVVTFRQIDPLFTLDLADAGAAARARRAEDPRLLRLPAPDRRRPAARHRPGRRRARAARSGTQLSLFDVSDLRKPTRLHSAAARPGLVRGRVRPPRVPLLAEDRARRDPVRAARRRLPRRPRARDRPLGTRRARGGSAYAGSAARSSSATAVLTVSDAGVKSSSLATLAERGWAAFPATKP